MAIAGVATAAVMKISPAPVAELAAAALKGKADAEMQGDVDYLVIAVPAGRADDALAALEDLDLGQHKTRRTPA